MVLLALCGLGPGPVPGPHVALTTPYQPIPPPYRFALMLPLQPLTNRYRPPHLPSPENSVAQSSSLKIAQLASQCCSRGQMGCSTATVPASVHFTVACVVYCLNDPVSASREVFVVSSVVASRLATAFLTGN